MRRNYSSVCYIRSVKAGYDLPVMGIVTTGLSEHLPVYSIETYRAAQRAAEEERPVYIDVIRSGRGKPYIIRVHTLRSEDASRPCITCGTESPQHEASQWSKVPYFACPRCHRLMFLGHVPAYEPAGAC